MKSYRSISLIVALCLLASPAAVAQEKKWEITPSVGYTFSDGVRVQVRDIGNGRLIDRLAAQSGFSWGISAEYFFSEAVSVGFLFNDQLSGFEIRDTTGAKEKLADMNLRNYHGFLGIHLADEDSDVRPYLLFGAGATQFAPSSVNGQKIDSSTRFSTTLGGGIKVAGGENLGFRLGARWTPNYIFTDPQGFWCSPFWPFGCWVVGNTEYVHQLELSAGVIIRF